MTRLYKTLLLTGTVGIGLLAIGTSPARADIIPALDSVTPAGSNFLWSYHADLHESQRLDASLSYSDFFTIYDFAGYVPGSATSPAGWIVSSSNVGLTPPFSLPIPPADDPGIPNLTWTFNDATIIGGPATIPGFTAISTGSSPTLGSYTSQSTNNTSSTPPNGLPGDNSGYVSVPDAPEPCTMALLGLGAAPLLGGLRRRGRKS